jgi:hypothetical protein
MTYREPQPWDFAEPERLLQEIVARTPLRVDGPVLGLVSDAAGRCELVETTRVRVEVGTHWNDASDVLRAAAERLPLPNDSGRPRPSLLLVVARPGRVVFGPTEEYWLRACRYINLGRPIFGPEVVLATEHGWQFFLQRACGAEPRLPHRDISKSAS